MANHSDEELLALIRRRAEALGRSPLRNEVQHHREIAARFGGWNKAVEAAGLVPYDVNDLLKQRQPREGKYTKEELISILQHKAKELGRPPKKMEVPEFREIKTMLGPWNTALRAAGLDPHEISRHPQPTPEEDKS